MKRNLCLALLLVFVTTSGWAQGVPQVLRVEQARPLGEATRLLQERYGWLINYEDPPYLDPRDWVDVTHPSRVGLGRAIDPRGGRVEIRYHHSPETHAPDSPPEELLRMLIDDHARRGNPGDFELRVIEGVCSVVPVQGSILDVPIALPPAERTFEEVIREIVDALTEAVGIPVRGPAMLRPGGPRFAFEADGEPASRVLARVFALRADYDYSWRLLHGPTWGYVLNLSWREAPKPAPPAEPEGPPTRWVWREVMLPDGLRTLRLVEEPEEP